MLPVKSGRPFRTPRFDEEARVFVDSPTFRGFPLGGIGNGGLSLYADGGFSEARTNHSWYAPARDLRGSFFAVRAKRSAGAPIARLLRRDHHASEEFAVDNIAHTRFAGRLPFFELEFSDEALPVEVTLRGFSALAPHDIETSALPAVFFDLELHNPSGELVDASALFSWQNILGITGTGGSALIAQHTFRCDFSRDGYALPAKDELPGVEFLLGRDFHPKDPRRRGVGAYLISVSPWNPAARFWTCRGWDERASVPSFWRHFCATGELDQRNQSGGRSSAIAVSTTLAPKERFVAPFLLCWWMPHYVTQKRSRLKLPLRRYDGEDHGVLSARQHDSVYDVQRSAQTQRGAIEKKSGQLRALLEDPERCNLPAWLIDVALNSADSVITNSVLTRRGGYYTIEGVDWRLWQPLTHIEWPFGALTGTNDQRLAAHPFTSTFFPEQDLAELRSFLRLTENGKVPHGNGGAEIALDDADTPYSKPIPALNGGRSDWPDLTCSWILQWGRHVLRSGRRSLLDEAWPKIQQMDGYLRSLVVDELPEGASTYDLFSYEPGFLYTATLWATTCEMLGRLAQLKGEDARGFFSRAARVRETIERRLWNEAGGFYNVCEGRPHLFAGGLAGDWTARLCGLQPAVPAERARRHVRAQHAALVEGAKAAGELSLRFGGRPLPFNEATPDGREVPLRFLGLYDKRGVHYIYQTVAYLGFEAIYLGMVELGLDAIKMIYDKAYQEGYPWDMNLVGLPGFIYMTHPVVWALFDALTGAALDAPSRTLKLAPQPLADARELRCPIFLPGAWLSLQWDFEAQRGALSVLDSPCPTPPLIDTIELTLGGTTRTLNVGPVELNPGRRIGLGR